MREAFKTEMQNGGPNNSDILQNWFPQKLGPPLLFLEILRLLEKYPWIIQNTLKCNEQRRIWVHRTFKIEIQKGGPNNSVILQNWFPPEIRSPLFNLYKFGNPERSTTESYKMHWNLRNGEEFGSRKLLKLKNRRGNQIIQTFCKISSPQKLGHPSLICRNFRTLRKVFLIHAEWTEI